ncbi:MAG: hypothetical protein H7235_04300, partial [Bdellovibrionaceae bacterium]|nr:hypothetical protein [Pseudobdellovibrionaceae bacterium]
MGILQIRQTTNKGQTKVWKLDSRDKRVTFGLSRKAGLSSIDPTHSPYQAVIEFSQGQWHFVQFEFNCKNPLMLIKDNTHVEFAHSSLQFHIIEKPAFVASRLDAMQTTGPLQRKIVIVSKGQKILKTEVLKIDEPFHFGIAGTKHLIPFKNTKDWDLQTIEEFQFKSKLIQVEDLDALGKLSSDQMVDKESKKLLFATLFSMVLLVTIGLFSSKTEVVQKNPVPVAAQNVVVKIDKKEKIKRAQQRAQAAAEKAAPAAQQAQSTPQQASASPNKVSAMLKGAIGARISQLIGKVSSTDARTANVIATAQGIKAGSGPSGRALAALGNMDSSGRNWTGEAVGTQRGVSTAGIAGGKGSSGLGSGLAAGKTGAGGVGLLEEESEVEGGLDREIIAQYIKSQLGHILACYERQLAARPELHGKISIKFIIS